MTRTRIWTAAARQVRRPSRPAEGSDSFWFTCPRCGQPLEACSCVCPFCGESAGCRCCIGYGVATGG
ncbi:MAG TPA: hypothetical protein VIL45_07760 [Thermoplasmata archaeon]